MSILRVVANPADVGVGGYVWKTGTNARFDNTRVEGAFYFNQEQVLTVPHEPRTTVWYHYRLAVDYSFGGGTLFDVRDINSQIVVTLGCVTGPGLRVSAVGGGGTVNGPTVPISPGAAYSVDIQVTIGSTVAVNMYVNGALVATATAANTTGTVRAAASMFNMENTTSGSNPWFSEVMAADEDTRGMRVRELRPRSFGIFQEWDGSISNIRDTDLTTGLSVEEPNRRVSFGVTNLENIKTGDIINRVVAQSYAQRGEAGLTQFNHFFRHRDGSVTDGGAQNLGLTGAFYVEDFLVNPKTGLPWTPEDFRSLQTGVRSLA